MLLLNEINFLNPVAVLHSFNFFFDCGFIPFNDQFYSHSNLWDLQLKKYHLIHCNA